MEMPTEMPFSAQKEAQRGHVEVHTLESAAKDSDLESTVKGSKAVYL